MLVMYEELFMDDPKDRKRRFFRGLTALAGGSRSYCHEDEMQLSNALRVNIREFRNQLANIYCLEFSVEELRTLVDSEITLKEFTEKYVPIIYDSRNVSFSQLVKNFIEVSDDGEPVVNLAKMDRALKYGINGSEWCDVVTGSCSCGTLHY